MCGRRRDAAPTHAACQVLSLCASWAASGGMLESDKASYAATRDSTRRPVSRRQRPDRAVFRRRAGVCGGRKPAARLRAPTGSDRTNATGQTRQIPYPRERPVALRHRRWEYRGWPFQYGRRPPLSMPRGADRWEGGPPPSHRRIDIFISSVHSCPWRVQQNELRRPSWKRDAAIRGLSATSSSRAHRDRPPFGAFRAGGGRVGGVVVGWLLRAGLALAWCAASGAGDMMVDRDSRGRRRAGARTQHGAFRCRPEAVS